MIGTLVKTFWQSTIINGKSFLTNDLSDKYTKGKFVISVFYLIVLANAIQTFSSASQFPEWNLIVNAGDLFEPIWSVKFLPVQYWEVCVRGIMLLFLLFSFLGAALWDKFRTIRAGVFLSMFAYLSLISSFGKIDHSMHILLITTFLLVFLPGKNDGEEFKNDFLRVVFGVQTFVLLTYFVSGIFKFYGIIDQEFAGLKSALSPDSLAQNLSKTSFAHDSEYFFSTLILENPSYAFSLVLIIGYFVEFASIYIIFKPTLHRVWGLLLIGLHAGILLSVGPDFSLQIIMVGLFLFLSPFSDDDLLSVFKPSSKGVRRAAVTSKSRSENSILVYPDDKSVLSNRFTGLISNFRFPKEMKICGRQDGRFHQLMLENPELKEVDSVIVVEITEGAERIRIKASAVFWILAKLKKRFVLLNVGHQLLPYLGNSLYDVLATFKSKSAKGNG